MSELRFDADTHTYYLGNEKLPSVTQILKPLYDFSAVPVDVLERACRFGTAVHQTIEYYLADDLDEDSLDEPLHNCLLAFKAFQSDHYDIFEETPVVEKPGYHPKLKYAGTPDLVFPSRAIDLKSRKVNMLTDAIQVAGYDHMTGKGNRERYVLELYQDTSYNLVRLNPTKKSGDLAWSRFRLLLDHYRNKQEIERWK